MNGQTAHTAAMGQATAHALDQAYARYRLRLSEADVAEIVHQIESGEAPQIERRPDDAATYAVRCRGRDMLTVWHQGVGLILTFVLPRGGATVRSWGGHR